MTQTPILSPMAVSLGTMQPSPVETNRGLVRVTIPGLDQYLQ